MPSHCRVQYFQNLLQMLCQKWSTLKRLSALWSNIELFNSCLNQNISLTEAFNTLFTTQVKPTASKFAALHLNICQNGTITNQAWHQFRQYIAVTLAYQDQLIIHASRSLAVPQPCGCQFSCKHSLIDLQLHPVTSVFLAKIDLGNTNVKGDKAPQFFYKNKHNVFIHSHHPKK